MAISPIMDPFSIRISEVQDQDGINPQPSDKTESEFLLEEFLSPARLREIANNDNLESVTYLQMVVDTTENTLGNFGSYLPNVKELDLSNSVLSSVRDMGSSLAKLEVLWLRKCQLVELDGLPTFYNLTELYLAYNHINNLSDLSMMENLRTLDLEANDIDDIDQVLFIAMCSSLQNLSLLHNPICTAPKPMLPFDPEYNYRTAVKNILKGIKTLDDIPIQDESQNFLQLDEDLQLVTENIKCGLSAEMHPDGTQSCLGRPGTARRPASALMTRRPASAMANMSTKPMFGFRPGTASMFDRPMTGTRTSPFQQTRPDTSSSMDSNDSAIDVDEFSKLTSGQVLCGNPIKALRMRKASSKTNKIQRLVTKTIVPDKPSLNTIPDTAEDTLDRLLDEMKEWKNEFESRNSENSQKNSLSLSNEVNILTLSTEDDSRNGHRIAQPPPLASSDKKPTSVRRRQYQSTNASNDYSSPINSAQHDEWFDDVDSGLASSRDTDTPFSDYGGSRGPFRSSNEQRTPSPKVLSNPKPPRPPLRMNGNGDVRPKVVLEPNNHKFQKPPLLPPHRLVSTRPKSSSPVVSDSKFS